MLSNVLRAVYCSFLGRLWRQSQYISSMSEAQGWSYPWAVPEENDSSSAQRESQRRYVETELQSGRFTRELRLFNV